MPYLQTSQDWLQQSSLLIKAYPTSTRISTKYSVSPPRLSRSKKRKQPSKDAESTGHDTETSQQTPSPKAKLTLKTYDPKSGACLKYKTDKAAEVGRLIAVLSRLGRNMAALLDEPADSTIGDAAAAEHATGRSTPVPEETQAKTLGPEAKSGQAAGGAGKKKKKGKR